jgi:glutamate carboxypeptidase
MVDAESPSSHPGAHHLIISILNEALSAIDYKVCITGLNGSYKHIYARRKSRSKNQQAQLLLGHYDTVWPLGTVYKRPFTVDGNIIRGPGVFDMKGGLAQIVFALKTISELDLPLPVEPVVFINSEGRAHFCTRTIDGRRRSDQDRTQGRRPIHYHGARKSGACGSRS